jgi:hypothetical protein
VRAVQLFDQHRKARIEVCFGTSKNIMNDPLSDLIISNLAEMDCAGLFQATRFKLYKTRRLPWAREFFRPRQGEASAIIGKLGDQSRQYLRELISPKNLPATAR